MKMHISHSLRFKRSQKVFLTITKSYLLEENFDPCFTYFSIEKDKINYEPRPKFCMLCLSFLCVNAREKVRPRIFYSFL